MQLMCRSACCYKRSTAAFIHMCCIYMYDIHMCCIYICIGYTCLYIHGDQDGVKQLLASSQKRKMKLGFLNVSSLGTASHGDSNSNGFTLAEVNILHHHDIEQLSLNHSRHFGCALPCQGATARAVTVPAALLRVTISPLFCHILCAGYIDVRDCNDAVI